VDNVVLDPAANATLRDLTGAELAAVRGPAPCTRWQSAR
jgi:hypothetical protein